MTTRITPMLIFVVSYLAIFLLLMSIMPILAPNLLYSGKWYESSFTIPSYFSAEDIENIKYFKNETITQVGDATTFDFNPDVNVKINVYWWSDIMGDKLGIYHITWEWWIFYIEHEMSVELEDEYITIEEALLNWEEEYHASIFYPVSCNHVTVKIWITDTDHARNDLREAWEEEGELEMGIGFGMDDISTAYSAYNLIGLLLTFQSPEIFGATGIIAVTLNLIVNSSIYLAIAYLVFYFITSIIPFIRGA